MPVLRIPDCLSEGLIVHRWDARYACSTSIRTTPAPQIVPFDHRDYTELTADEASTTVLTQQPRGRLRSARMASTWCNWALRRCGHPSLDQHFFLAGRRHEHDSSSAHPRFLPQLPMTPPCCGGVADDAVVRSCECNDWLFKANEAAMKFSLSCTSVGTRWADPRALRPHGHYLVRHDSPGPATITRSFRRRSSADLTRHGSSQRVATHGQPDGARPDHRRWCAAVDGTFLPAHVRGCCATARASCRSAVFRPLCTHCWRYGRSSWGMRASQVRCQASP